MQNILHKVLQQSVNYIPWKLRYLIRHIPGIAEFQRWLIQKYISEKNFIHTINAGPGKGLSVCIKLPEDKGLWTGTYENQFVDAIAKTIKSGFTCLDIGSYHGFIGGVMAINGAKQVICFDPMPKNVDEIRKLISLNPQLKIQVRQEAVGADDGIETFEIMLKESMGKLSGSKFQCYAIGGSTLKVQVRSIDSLWAENVFEIPDIIKIDVEGSEAAVLKGAKRILDLGSPQIFIETHSQKLNEECKQILKRYNYICKNLSGSGASAFSKNEISHLKATKTLYST